MFEKLAKYNSPYLLSLIFHTVLVLAILYNFAKPNNESTVSVSIVSEPIIAQIYTNKKQALDDQAKMHNHIKPEIETAQDNALAKKDQDSSKEKPQQTINDLSYSKKIYEIGSKQNPTPPYPRIAKLRNYQGKVEICAIIDAKGSVIDVQIHQSSNYAILDKSALETLKKWKFNITNLSNSQINQDQYYKIIVPINFVLEK